VNCRSAASGDGDVSTDAPIVVSRLDLRLIEHGVGEEIARDELVERSATPAAGRWAGTPTSPSQSGGGLRVAVRGEAFAAGQRQRCQSNDNE